MKNRAYKQSKELNIAIVSGGELRVSQLRTIKTAFYIIGVDRGAYWLIKHHIPTDIAVGDFDSVNASERRLIEKHARRMVVHPVKKDATDLELAIDEAIALHPQSVMVYGAIGTRFDHTLAAIGLLMRLESHNILGQIVDNFNKINIVRRQMNITKEGEFRYVSLIPLGSPAVVTLKGFEYNVTHTLLRTDSSLGISNEISKKSALINVHKGAVLVIRSRD